MKKNYQMEFINNSGFRINAAFFGGIFSRAIKYLLAEKIADQSGGQIVLVLTDDRQIKKINKEYRGLNKPTDVISLSYYKQTFEGAKLKKTSYFPENNLIGEIFISLDTTKKQAKKLGHPVKQELEFLFVHGMLHIFGFDHETEKERKIMFKRQEEIISNF